MALKIAGIEPVELGERKCRPRMDADKRLRLSQLNYKTKNDIAKAVETIAKCFPDDEDYVQDFLANNAGVQDIQLVALYLRGGQQALNTYQQAFDKLVAEAVEKASAGENNADN